MKENINWEDIAKNFFGVTIVSGDVHYRKPDLQIFSCFLKDANTYAEECIFSNLIN